MRCTTKLPPRLNQIICAAVWATFCFSAAGSVLAHEGHAPLPTRGVQVDPAKCLLTLSPDASRGRDEPEFGLRHRQRAATP